MGQGRAGARVLGLTTVAMVAFAANSVLCRLALADEAIDPLSFTTLRVVAGALVLLALTIGGRRSVEAGGLGDWKRAFFLLGYALPFSLAYVVLDTGTGALLLFGGVQLTMLGLGIRRGERPSPAEWMAIVGAGAGLVYLVSPGVTAPDPLGAVLMLVAGAGWGLYSIAGQGLDDPTARTAAAFGRAALLVTPVAVIFHGRLSMSTEGAIYALISGGVTSGLGYAIWYLALRDLTATRAALVQLSVPVIAAAGGVAFLSEEVTSRLAIASVVTLGSIALGVSQQRRR